MSSGSRDDHNIFMAFDLRRILYVTNHLLMIPHLNSIIIDGIPLDNDNGAFRRGLQLILGEQKNVYVTGNAGTGKTVFLKALRHISKKRIVVAAPTGVAAVNAGGMTLHSLFHLKFQPMLPTDYMFRTKPADDDPEGMTIFSEFRFENNRLELFRNMDILVIDEVAMVRCDMLDAIDRILRVFRKRMNEPFGGVQVVLIGDPFQLPPIVKEEEVGILRKSYQHRFFFGSHVWSEAHFESVELTRIYRQHDPRFIALLGRVRRGEVTPADHVLFRQRQHMPLDREGFVTICTHRAKVDAMNREEFEKVPGLVFEYRADIDGVFPNRNWPADFELKLKEGVPVMFLKNDRETAVINGTIGKVVSLSGESIVVEIPDDKGVREVEVMRASWENAVFEYSQETKSVERKVLGTFTQFPLRLAWAITVHKSQGMTFQKVIADLQQAFSYGQEYVGLSRCVSLQTLHLMSNVRAKMLGPHPHAVRFYRELFG